MFSGGKGQGEGRLIQTIHRLVHQGITGELQNLRHIQRFDQLFHHIARGRLKILRALLPDRPPVSHPVQPHAVAVDHLHFQRGHFGRINIAQLPVAERIGTVGEGDRVHQFTLHLEFHLALAVAADGFLGGQIRVREKRQGDSLAVIRPIRPKRDLGKHLTGGQSGATSGSGREAGQFGARDHVEEILDHRLIGPGVGQRAGDDPGSAIGIIGGFTADLDLALSAFHGEFPDALGGIFGQRPVPEFIRRLHQKIAQIRADNVNILTGFDIGELDIHRLPEGGGAAYLQFHETGAAGPAVGDFHRTAVIEADGGFLDLAGSDLVPVKGVEDARLGHKIEQQLHRFTAGPVLDPPGHLPGAVLTAAEGQLAAGAVHINPADLIRGDLQRHGFIPQDIPFQIEEEKTGQITRRLTAFMQQHVGNQARREQEKQEGGAQFHRKGKIS